MNWERYERQQPQDGFVRLGLSCPVGCMQGPCRIDPFRRGAEKGICGLTGDGMVAAFLLRQERIEGGSGVTEARLIDLTDLAVQAGKDTGMLAAAASAGGATIFVKLTAPVDFLRKERVRFLVFCRSMRVES